MPDTVLLPVRQRCFPSVFLKQPVKTLFIFVSVFNHQLLNRSFCFDQLITKLLHPHFMHKLNRRNTVQFLKQVAKARFAVSGHPDIMIQRIILIPVLLNFFPDPGKGMVLFFIL